MKKIILFFVVINFNLLFAHNISFSIRPFFSYNNDYLSYSIYEDDDDSRLNSRLDWCTSYLLKAGLETKIEFSNWILGLSNAAALPFKCGKMYDSDWFTEGIKTDFQEDILTAGFCYDLQFELKYRFRLQNQFSIFPIFAYNYSYSSFKGDYLSCWTGRADYTGLTDNYPWNSDVAVKVERFGIDLYNNISVFFLGAGFEKKFNRCQLNLDIYLSPFVFISSIDHHLNESGGRYYLLEQKAFFSSMRIDFSCACIINQKNKLIFSPDICMCKKVMGEFYKGKERNEDMLFDQACSFRFYKFSFSFGWEIEL